MLYLESDERQYLAQIGKALAQAVDEEFGLLTWSTPKVVISRDTNGGYVTVAALGDPRCEIGVWLDTWAGSGKRHLWYGFSGSTVAIRTLKTAARRQYGEPGHYDGPEGESKVAFGKTHVESYYRLQWYGIYRKSWPAARSLVPQIIRFISAALDSEARSRANRRPRKGKRMVRTSDCSPRVRSDLINMYKRKCQVCRRRIVLPTGDCGLEGHHIWPRHAKGSKDDLRNVLLLCPNHHLEFDRLALAIRPQRPRPQSHRLVHFKGAKHCVRRTLLTHDRHRISLESIEHHWRRFMNARPR